MSRNLCYSTRQTFLGRLGLTLENWNVVSPEQFEENAITNLRGIRRSEDFIEEIVHAMVRDHEVAQIDCGQIWTGEGRLFKYPCRPVEQERRAWTPEIIRILAYS